MIQSFSYGERIQMISYCLSTVGYTTVSVTILKPYRNTDKDFNKITLTQKGREVFQELINDLVKTDIISSLIKLEANIVQIFIQYDPGRMFKLKLFN